MFFVCFPNEVNICFIALIVSVLKFSEFNTHIRFQYLTCFLGPKLAHFTPLCRSKIQLRKVNLIRFRRKYLLLFWSLVVTVLLTLVQNIIISSDFYNYSNYFFKHILQVCLQLSKPKSKNDKHCIFLGYFLY